MTREQPSLSSPPASTQALRSFPIWHVHAGALMHRVARAGEGPWWFSSDSTGRFDLDPPRGTCYLADDPVVALLETLGPSELVPAEWLARRRWWAVPMPVQCDAADATVRGARRFGVTAELATITPYALPRSWAAALARAGFGGVRYRARHDPGGGRCLAMFGRAGERRSWRRGRRHVIDDGLLQRLFDQAGVAASAVPMSQDLSELRDRPPD